MRAGLFLLGATLATVCSACGTLPVPRFEANGAAERAAPFGPGYMLLPLGTDDDALLGQVLAKSPAPGQALEEIAEPNPCRDKLAAASTIGAVSVVEDAQELKASAQGRAVLGVYGFQADAKRATHFMYKLSTERKSIRSGGAEYLACCRQKSCGYGVVTELVYGDGDYSAAEETSGTAAVDVVNIAGAHGTASLKVLHKRHVHGWIAAKVMAHPNEVDAEPRPGNAIGPIGPTNVLLDVDSASALTKQLYDREKIGICQVDEGWAFCDAKDKLDERRFAASYMGLLHTNELEDLRARRNTGWLLGTFGTGVAGFALSAALVPGARNSERGIPPATLVGLGAGIAVGSLGVTLGVLALGDQIPVTDHKLTRPDAQSLLDRYNRALLRKVTADVEESRWDAKPTAAAPARVYLHPILGLGSAGVGGAF